MCYPPRPLGTPRKEVMSWHPHPHCLGKVEMVFAPPIILGISIERTKNKYEMTKTKDISTEEMIKELNDRGYVVANVEDCEEVCPDEKTPGELLAAERLENKRLSEENKALSFSNEQYRTVISLYESRKIITDIEHCAFERTVNDLREKEEVIAGLSLEIAGLQKRLKKSRKRCASLRSLVRGLQSDIDDMLRAREEERNAVQEHLLYIKLGEKEKKPLWWRVFRR